MNDIGFQLGKEYTLEKILENKNDILNQIDYSERYKKINESLSAIQEKVGTGAMVASFDSYFKNLQSKCLLIFEDPDEKNRKERYERLFENNPALYLNDHGPNHTKKVIEKASDMLHNFRDGHLTQYEAFILLCAIQLHDVGNIFGREDHEKKIGDLIDVACKANIPDNIEKRVIEKIAMVHGGNVSGNKDTISFLSTTKILHDRTVRKRLLAALLRFGDELADDSSRADQFGMKLEIIPPLSQIYHYYSSVLHTVSFTENAETNDFQLNLYYEFDSDLVDRKFNTIEGDKYLLDEIYDRTLKMERERRYCMRFMRRYFPLERIKVNITIQDDKKPLEYLEIKYTLEEDGYPSIPSQGMIRDFAPNAKPIDEVISCFKMGG